MVQVRLALPSAVLLGGVSTVAVVFPSENLIGRINLQQMFYQAVTYDEDPGEAPDRQEEIDRLVGERVDQYKKCWNAETGRYEIDMGTKTEWICTEDELYDDVRRSVEDELA